MRFLLLGLAAACAWAQSYAVDIAPLIERRCGGCHGGEAKMGELSVNTYESLMRGGNHGKPVVAGKPDDSLLYNSVIGKAYPKMPMDGTTLTEGETLLIRKWIEAGAPGPTAAEAEQLRRKSAQTAEPKIASRVTLKPRIFAMSWQPNGNLIALASHKKVFLADATTLAGVASLDGAVDSVRNVAFSLDGKLLAAAGGLCAKSGEVRIWNVESRSVTSTITGHSDCVYGLAFSPDGSLLATSSYDKLIKLWEVATGKEVRTLRDHIDAVYALEFTPDGKRLISGAADRTVKVWDVATGKRLFTLSEPTDGVNTIAVDGSGRFVAAGGQDKSIRIWRLNDTGGELVQSLMAHEDAIIKLAFSADGKLLASSSADKSVKIFRSDDLSELKVLPKLTDWAYGVRFSPDDSQLAVATLDGSVTLHSWRTPGPARQLALR